MVHEIVAVSPSMMTPSEGSTLVMDTVIAACAGPAVRTKANAANTNRTRKFWGNRKFIKKTTHP
ncbi:MAG: hypothetical protein M5R36_16835 [Deltaproteobacteria bacterium]|nr:hypothetical protein [Deltaproteobacteria bacterium]